MCLGMCIIIHKETVVRTNIVLDDALVEEAMSLTGIRTRRELVDEALKLLVATRRRKSLSELFGKIKLADGYDYKATRRSTP